MADEVLSPEAQFRAGVNATESEEKRRRAEARMAEQLALVPNGTKPADEAERGAGAASAGLRHPDQEDAPPCAVLRRHHGA